MKITNIKEQKLMNREEIDGFLEHKNSKTPTRKEIKELISRENKTPIELISLIKIKTIFGSNKTLFKAQIYHEISQLKNFEKRKKKEIKQ
ncbi:MAG TPA: hypothetical protein VJB89_01780 [Candidatus Nanoarchaeia archaeon]|nr:hypothetical protein [Candidatus Nanoarchaeia archaeon]